MVLTNLSAVPGDLLPRTITGPIFDRAIEQSAVMSRARRIPLAMDHATTIPVRMDIPEAGWVDEGGRKPTGTSGVTYKQMVGKKVALILGVSEELARTNAGGLYDQLQSDLPTAIARAFDKAAIHGKGRGTAAGPFANYLTQTTKFVELGTASQASGGIYADLVAGEKLLVDDEWDITGFVADPRLKPTLKSSVDLNGRPLFVSDQSAANVVATQGTLIGYPTSYSKGLSGKLLYASNTAAPDRGLRAIAGDWSQAAYGVGMDISISLSTEATIVEDDGTVVSAYQNNLVFLRVEAYYGFVIGETAAFVKYLDAVA